MELNKDTGITKKSGDLPIPVPGYTYRTKYAPAPEIRPTPLPNVVRSAPNATVIYQKHAQYSAPNNISQNLTTNQYVVPCSSGNINNIKTAEICYQDVDGLNLNRMQPIQVINLNQPLNIGPIPTNTQNITYLGSLLNCGNDVSTNEQQNIIQIIPQNSTNLSITDTTSSTVNANTSLPIVDAPSVINLDTVEQPQSVEVNMVYDGFREHSNLDNSGNDIETPTTEKENTNFFYSYDHHSQVMCQRLHAMQLKSQYCDVELRIEETSWSCHSCIIAATSNRLHNFMQSISENGPRKNRTIICLPEVLNVKTFSKILEMMYIGKLVLYKSDVQQALVIAEYLEITPVYNACVNFLKQYKSLNKILTLSKNIKKNQILNIINEDNPISNVEGEQFQNSSSERTQIQTVVPVRISQRLQLKKLEQKHQLQNDSLVNSKSNKKIIEYESCKTKNDDFDDLVKAAASEFLTSTAQDNNEFIETPAKKLPSQVDSEMCLASNSSVCRLCNKSFDNDSDRIDHIISLHKWDKMLMKKRCGICQKNFSNFRVLKKHTNSKHDGNRFQCRFCTQTFKLMFACQQHENCKHTKHSPYICKYCGKGFQNLHNCQRHIKTHGDNDKFRCTICAKVLTTKLGFDHHQTAVHGDKKWVCTFTGCDSRFGNERALIRHMNNHTLCREFKCNKCEKKFKHKAHLNRHIKELHTILETSLRPFSCELCDLRFNRSFQLKAHMASHSNERPHKCDLCNNSFKHKASLYVHLRKHSGLKEFVCDICGLGFVTKSRLSEHILTHSSQKPFHCETCGAKFKAKKYLNRHTQKHLKNELTKGDSVQQPSS